MIADPFDEDADIRSHLAALGRPRVGRVAPRPRGSLALPDPGPAALTARAISSDLATLIAMADTDEVVRLRLLRTIRDLGV